MALNPGFVLKFILELEVISVVNVVLVLGIAFDVVASCCQAVAPPKREKWKRTAKHEDQKQ